jgi:dihydrofolate reductase
VIRDISSSLDGYVTGPNDSRENPFGDGAGMLHDWMFDAAADEDRAILQEMLAGVGAIVMGRKGFDKNEGDGGWGDSGPVGDTHASLSPTTSRPRGTHPCRPSSPTASSARLSRPRARRATSSSARRDHLQQALPLSLVDEIRVHVIPVLLGGGTPLFDKLDSAITLERTHVLVTLPRRTWDFGVVR